MSESVFKHEAVDLGYNDLIAETGAKGRVYNTPDGQQYPSITTVLSILNEEHIQKWRARVGDEEANKISYRASTRGTAVHSLLEKYVDNDPNHLEGFMPNVIGSFQDVRPILDRCLTTVYAQEAPLYSQHLGVAGRVDCVGVWDGKPSIIDYKTAAKPKRKDWITNYFIQCCAYAIMWEERTGQAITQLVILIAVDGSEPQVFIEHRDNWDKQLIATINEYKRRQLFGR